MNLLLLGIVWPYLLVVATKLGMALLFTHVMPPEVQNVHIRALLTDENVMFNLARTCLFMTLGYLAVAASISNTTSVAARRLGDILVWVEGPSGAPLSMSDPKPEGGGQTPGAGTATQSPDDPQTSDTDALLSRGTQKDNPKSEAGILGRAWAVAMWPFTVALHLVVALVKGLFNDGRPAVTSLSALTLGSAHKALFLEVCHALTSVGTISQRASAVNHVLDKHRTSVAVSHPELLSAWDSAATDFRSSVLSRVMAGFDAVAVELYTVTFLYAPLYYAGVYGAWGILPVVIMAHVLYVPLVGARVLASGFSYVNVSALASTLLDTDGVLGATDTVLGAVATAFGFRFRGVVVLLRALVPCFGACIPEDHRVLI